MTKAMKVTLGGQPDPSHVQQLRSPPEGPRGLQRFSSPRKDRIRLPSNPNHVDPVRGWASRHHREEVLPRRGCRMPRLGAQHHIGWCRQLLTRLHATARALRRVAFHAATTPSVHSLHLFDYQSDRRSSKRLYRASVFLIPRLMHGKTCNSTCSTIDTASHHGYQQPCRCPCCACPWLLSRA